MQMFGHFCLTRGDKILDEEKLHSNKVTKLLAYMVINRNREVPFQELIDIFWEGTAKNPQNALKNLMYRLRSSLKELGTEEYILTLMGAYQWNPEINVETDYEYLEKLAREIQGEENKKQKKCLCKLAINSYNRTISETLGNESWIMTKVVWYRSLYVDIIKELGRIYKEEEDWHTLEMLCNSALAVDYTEEEIHYWLIESLWKQNKMELAMEHYENISKQLYDIAGINTSEKLQSIFREITRAAETGIKNIEYLFSEVEEVEEPKGAFYCDYQNFRQIYRMEVRRNQRMRMDEHVMMLTLQRSGGIKRDPAMDSALAEGMSLLGNWLRSNLRKGDVVTRYNLNQYIVLLPGCDYGSAVIVAERIKRLFYKGITNKHLELTYELKAISAKGMLKKDF